MEDKKYKSYIALYVYNFYYWGFVLADIRNNHFWLTYNTSECGNFDIVFIYFNIYRYIIRYTNIETIITITKAIVIYSFIYTLVSVNLYKGEKLSLFFIQLIIFYSIIIVVRLFFYNYLKFKPQNSKNANILIYGAGVAGINFAETVIKNSKFNLIAYIDDDPY